MAATENDASFAADQSTARHSAVQRLRDWLWGYDFFVSYHWQSGGSFAVALAQGLRSKGFEVFLDRTDYASGDDWQRLGRIALHNTQRLVLVATREAVTISTPVRREVEVFTDRGRQVIPIVFGDRFDDLDRAQYPTLARLPAATLFIDAGAAALAGSSAEQVVAELVRTHGVLRRRNLRALLTLLPFLFVGAFAAFATYQWRDAVLAENDARMSRDAEREARIEAEKNLKTAKNQRRQAVSTVQNTVFAVQDEVDRTPRGQRLQKRISEIVLAGLAGMEDDRLPDDDLIHMNSITRIEIAEFFSEVSGSGAEQADALENSRLILEKVVTDLEQIVAAHPQKAQYLRDLSWACNEIGENSLRSGRFEAALTYLRRGEASIEAAVKLVPTEMKFQRDRMWSCLKLGDYFEAQRARNAAASTAEEKQALMAEQLKYLQKAETIGDQLVEAHVDRADWELSSTLDRLCDLYLDMGKRDEGLACAKKVLELRQKILELSPDDKHARQNLGVAYDKMGQCYLQSDQGNMAIDWLSKSLALSEELQRDDPGSLEAEHDLAMAHFALGRAHLRLEAWELSLAALDRCATLISKQIAGDACNLKLQMEFLVARGISGDVLIATDEFEKAAAQFQQALDHLVQFQKDCEGADLQPQIEELRDRLRKCERKEK